MASSYHTPGLDSKTNGFIDKCVKAYRQKDAMYAGRPKKKGKKNG